MISDSLHADVSIIIVDKDHRERFPAMLERLRELRRQPWEAMEKMIVDKSWVKACAEVSK